MRNEDQKVEVSTAQLAQESPSADGLEHIFGAIQKSGKPATLFSISLDHLGDLSAGLPEASFSELLDQVHLRMSEIVVDHHGFGSQRNHGTTFLLFSAESGDMTELAREVLKEIRGPFHVGGTRLHLSASVGVAYFPIHATTIDHLIASAQSAVALARAAGGDTWHLHDPVNELLPQSKLDLSSALFGAVENGELFLIYQPQVCLQSGVIRGFEALIRWDRGDSGVVSPNVFIPLAEENGAILEIGAWVIREAAGEVQRWLSRGLPPIKMSVNISPRQLRHEGLAELISDVIRTHEIPAGCLGFEVTENALVHDFDACKTVLEAIRTVGAGVSMDDFGTGYCGLGYLGRLPFDTLKIDRSFVRGIPASTEKVAIVQALLQMAKALGMNTVAEGVETVEELRFLHAAGCDQIQGFLFSRPIPAADAQRLLRDGIRMDIEGLLRANS